MSIRNTQYAGNRPWVPHLEFRIEFQNELHIEEGFGFRNIGGQRGFEGTITFFLEWVNPGYLGGFGDLWWRQIRVEAQSYMSATPEDALRESIRGLIAQQFTDHTLNVSTGGGPCPEPEVLWFNVGFLPDWFLVILQEEFGTGDPVALLGPKLLNP